MSKGDMVEYFSFILALAWVVNGEYVLSRYQETYRFLPSSKLIASFESFQVDSMLRTCRMSD